MTVITQHAERPVELEGCVNFRDVGGLPIANGAAVRARRLFRSNALIGATAGDRRRLQELGVATVIDLRSDHEVAWSDDPVAPGATRHHLPLGDLLGRGDHWERWRDPVYVADRYFDLCQSGRASITGYLRHLDVISAIPFLGAALIEDHAAMR